MSQIYDARTGTYIRGGTSSADPGGQSVYHVDDWQNASSYKDPSNPLSVSYPAAASGGVSASQNGLAEVANSAIQPSYMNGYSALVDGFLGAFNSNNDMLHDLISSQMNLSERNSALSQEMADKANAFSSNEAALARAWSGQQAKINRDWQTQMSNTAHQREVADLIASGLNPILSANNGASTGNSGVPSASMAQSHQGQVDTTSAYGMAANVMSSMINSATQLKSLDVQQLMQDKNLQVTREQMNNDLLRSQISGQYQLDSANASAYGNIVASQNNAAATKYRADIDQEINTQRNETNKYIAELDSQTRHDTSETGLLVDFFNNPEKYADTAVDFLRYFVGDLTDPSKIKQDPYWNEGNYNGKKENTYKSSYPQGGVDANY